MELMERGQRMATVFIKGQRWFIDWGNKRLINCNNPKQIKAIPKDAYDHFYNLTHR